MNKNLNRITNLMPLFFLFLAIYAKLFPPQNIHTSYGYRTALSAKCLENWHFSNQLFADLLLYSIIAIIFLQVMVYFFTPNFYKKYNFLWLLLYAMVPIVAGLITEVALEKFSVCE